MEKIRNRTKVEYNGIKFDSTLECNVYRVLTEEFNVPLIHHPKGIYVLPKFDFGGSHIRGCYYTPDFVVDRDDDVHIFIESKGKAMSVDELRIKLFTYWLAQNDPSAEYFVVKNLKEARMLGIYLTEGLLSVPDTKIFKLMSSGSCKRPKKLTKNVSKHE